MGLGGACRREELSNLKLGDIENVGSALLESVNNTKTKVYRTFAIIDNDKESLDFLDMYRRYIALRPSHVQHRRLFLKYKNGKCVNQVVGKNTLGSLPRKIAEFLKLENPADYTGHCFRCSSATLAANTGTDMTNLKRLGGWKSSTTAESYIDNSHKTKLNIAKNVLVGESCASVAGASKSSPPRSVSMSTSSPSSKKIKLDESLPANPVAIDVPATDQNIQQSQVLTLKIDINVNVNK
jgi:integrase